MPQIWLRPCQPLFAIGTNWVFFKRAKTRISVMDHRPTHSPKRKKRRRTTMHLEKSHVVVDVLRKQVMLFMSI